MTPLPIQHDDHIWLTVLGDGWAICGIDRRHGMKLHLWRGWISDDPNDRGPGLEWISIDVSDTDWTLYCATALIFLQREESTCPMK